MSVTDLRISTDLFTHWKIRKLKKRHGAEGVLALITLWSWVAKHRPTGDLSGLDADDIELAAEWSGEGLLSTLVELNLIDGEPDEYSVHNWEKISLGHTTQKREAKQQEKKRVKGGMLDAMQTAMLTA